MLGFLEHVFSLLPTHFCCGDVEAATGNMETNDRGYIPTEFYLWSLKFEFHIIFTGHKIFFFLLFSTI